MSFIDDIKDYSDALIRKLEAEEKSPNTLVSYSRTYKQFIIFCIQSKKNLTFQNIKENDIYTFLEYKNNLLQKQGSLSQSTKNSLIVHLRRLFHYIERNAEELYDFKKVFDDIKINQPKRTPKGLSKKERVILENYLNEDKMRYTELRNAILIKLMLFSGLRASEVLSIKFSDFHKMQNLYRISFIGKGNKERTSYINTKEISSELNKMMSIYDKETEDLIALTSSEKTMDRFQLHSAVTSIYKRIGIKPQGIHILRHTAIKKFVSDGVNIVNIQALSGHSSLQTTSIYSNPTSEMIYDDLIKIQNKETA